MNTRRFHRAVGILLVLPMIGWAVTGFVFFIKPGYGGAYEALPTKTYPQEPGRSITPSADWLEFRGFRTVLGDHLLVRTGSGWRHLEARTLQPMAPPSDDQVRRLVTDAMTANPARYGSIARVSNGVVTTDTGVEVTLDWSRVSLQQRGRDTDRIDRLYKVHYLQWTGVEDLDRVLGFTGLILVLALTGAGVRLILRRA